jgi:hypothetical protein
MRNVALIAVCLATAGCAATAPPHRHAPLASRVCTGVAQQRADDAAVNGIEPAMQMVIFNDSYADCVHWQDKATFTSNRPP